MMPPGEARRELYSTQQFGSPADNYVAATPAPSRSPAPRPAWRRSRPSGRRHFVSLVVTMVKAAGDPEFPLALGSEHHEDQEDKQHPATENCPMTLGRGRSASSLRSSREPRWL